MENELFPFIVFEHPSLGKVPDPVSRKKMLRILNADLDPGSQFIADPDPGQTLPSRKEGF